MPIDQTPQLIHDMIAEESFRATPYQDDEGFWTRGIGEHDGVTENSPPVTYEQAIQNLSDRLTKAATDARAVVGPQTFDGLNQVRKDCLTDLSYNMGKAGLASFYPAINFIQKGDFASAAYHLVVNQSGTLQKYVQQVGARAFKIALRIATGSIIQEQIFSA